MAENDVKTRIEGLLKEAPVVLFMKGNRRFPQCGFSATVVQLLDGILPDYKTVNVLDDPDIRQGVKDFSNWPTVPQLYVGGEFVGGCDIVKDMYASGDLHQTLGVSKEDIKPPTIQITESAAEELKAALAQADEGDAITISIDAHFEHALNLGVPAAMDVPVTAAGITVFFDPASAKRAEGMSIDFVEEANQAGFKIENPQAPPKVNAISAEALSKKLKDGAIKEFYDVRPQEERDIASISAAKPMSETTMQHIMGLPKDTPLAFHCHHGQRSLSACEHFRQEGFTEVYNLVGGIAAWSKDVDPDVPGY